MDNNIKEIIKIPDGLDDAILKGFKRAKRENSQKVLFKRSIIAAGIIMVNIIVVGIINPKAVSAIPVLKNVFEYFNDGIYKQNSDKYQEIGNDVNISVDDNNVKVTLKKIIIDDNILMGSLLVESDKLLGYDKLNKPQDFINGEFDISINGQSPKSYGGNVTIVDERTAAIVLESNISNLKLDDDVNINLSIKQFTRGKQNIARGHWNFSVKVKKGSESNTHEVNKSLALTDEDSDVNVQKLVVTPLENKLYFTGNFTGDNHFKLSEQDFIIRDNNNKTLTTDFSSGTSHSDGKYQYTFDILNDLSNTEYIEVIKANGNKALIMDNGNYLLKCSSSDKENAKLNTKFISREPTEKELSDGYGLDKVMYNLDIDKNTAFESIDSLIGKDIVVNNSSKIIVKDIVAYDDYTEVVIRIDGNYNYKLLGNIVLFDENMNDSSSFEGSVTNLNDIEEKIVTVKLTNIDINKKYTIGIPVTTDLDLDENEKVTIKLK